MDAEHCRLFRAFDEAYLRLAASLCREAGEDAVREDYLAWLGTRENCAVVMVAAADAGRRDLMGALDLAVGLAYGSLTGTWGDLLREHEKYREAREKVFALLCPTGAARRRWDVLNVEAGVHGRRLDVRKLAGLSAEDAGAECLAR